MVYSRAQILLGRVLRSTLPAASEVLTPTTPRDVHQALAAQQRKQECYYHEGAKTLPELQAGSTIHIETGKGWQPGLVVISKCNEPRSYDVVTSVGQHYRRNRRHLRKNT